MSLFSFLYYNLFFLSFLLGKGWEVRIVFLMKKIGDRLSRVESDDGYKMRFGWGNFDKYCVHVYDTVNRKKWFPLDEEYFQWIYDLSMVFGVDNVFDDFLLLYENVDVDSTNNDCYYLTKGLDLHYPSIDTQHWWMIFYMTMYAECVKKGAILKKRIKLLGVYNILYDGYSIPYVVKYMRDMSWYELDDLMYERGL